MQLAVGVVEVSPLRLAVGRQTAADAGRDPAAIELTGVYDEIERELRTQYLLAYSSDSARPEGEFRRIEVKVRNRGLEARTIGGYYP